MHDLRLAHEAANMVRYDGSPFDTKIDVQFKETRVLTRRDIDDMDLGISDLGVDPLTGLARPTIAAGATIPIPTPATSVARPVPRLNPNMPTSMTGPFPHQS